MRLSCPGCQTEYEVPDAALAGRVRTLRCANCGHQWEYGPLAVASVADPSAAAWPGAAPRKAAPPPASAPFTQATYEPLDPPERGTWPPPPSAEPLSERGYTPLASEPEPAYMPAETGDEPATDDPSPLPETGRETAVKPAAGNEERFAALVKTSRNESDFNEPRPSIRAGLFTTIILLIGIGAGLWAARFHIMQAWPPSIRLFDIVNNIIASFTTPHH